jgi:hypothetical protein
MLAALHPSIKYREMLAMLVCSLDNMSRVCIIRIFRATAALTALIQVSFLNFYDLNSKRKK